MNLFLDKEADQEERNIREILFVEQAFTDKLLLSCGRLNLFISLIEWTGWEMAL